MSEVIDLTESPSSPKKRKKMGSEHSSPDRHGVQAEHIQSRQLELQLQTLFPTADPERVRSLVLSRLTEGKGPQEVLESVASDLLEPTSVSIDRSDEDAKLAASLQQELWQEVGNERQRGDEETARALQEEESARAVSGAQQAACLQIDEAFALAIREEEEREALAALQDKYGFTESSDSQPLSNCRPDPAPSVEEWSGRTPDLLPLIAECLLKEARAKGNGAPLCRVTICRDTDFFWSVYRFHKAGDQGLPQKLDSASRPGAAGAPTGDMGWGCGYRNIQILVSHLMRRHSVGEKQNYPYRDELFGRLSGVPSIRSLQEHIEAAWARGWDTEGAGQLGNKLIGTRKWIGTTEAAALLRSQGVPAEIVDFKSGMHEGERDMVHWACKYFEEGRQSDVPRTAGSMALFNSHRPPLYLQHDGHSRTVVGTLQQGDLCQLLVFDPSQYGPAMLNSLKSGKDWQRRIKRGAKTFTRPEFQILYVPNDGLVPQSLMQDSETACPLGFAKVSQGSSEEQANRSVFMTKEEKEKSKILVASEKYGNGF
mmetsp:Transcript_5073/g.8161  ORF Transcript_5073/g.8161 Transcript_5073/m.8161 type:complete len:541 (+) Transcript_5073:169-1791(+)